VKELKLKEKEQDRAEAPASADEALLDEFFSLVASIAVRLTRDDTQRNNGDDSVGREVIKP